MYVIYITKAIKHISSFPPYVSSRCKMLKKQKLQMTQQQVAAAVAAAQGQQASSTQQPQQVQAAPATQASPQLTAVAAPRAGAMLAGTTVTNLQVARLVSHLISLWS